MEIVQKTALITVNATLVFELISFLILVFILHRLMLKPLRATMQQREDYLDQMEKDVETGEVKLLALEDKLSAKKKEFFLESSNLRKQLMEEAASAGTHIIAEARAKVTQELHEATKASHAEADRIRSEFDQLAETLSQDIIAKVLDRQPSSRFDLTK